MPVRTLSVENLRVLQRVQLEPGAGINWIRGANGSGKTSLVEALHLVGTGRTFSGRSELDPLIRDGADHLTVRIVGDDLPAYRLTKLRRGPRRLCRIPDQDVGQREVARALPLVTVHSLSTQLIDGSSQHRRRYLDWGPYHSDVEHARALQAYQRLLRQRNAALRRGESDRLIRSWDAQMAHLADLLHSRRSTYLQGLEPHLVPLLEALLPGRDLSMSIHPGWSSKHESFEQALAAALPQDRQRGYTSVGPHRADLTLCIDERPVRERLSRGEKRRLALALRLAQLAWLRDQPGARAPLLILDDFGNELDQEGGRAALEQAHRLACQTFVTSTDRLAEEYLDAVPVDAVFCMDRGAVRTVSSRT